MQGSTITAVATGPSRGGIAVVRVSGPRALLATRPLAVSIPAEPSPRHAYLTALVDRAGHLLDEGVFLYFAAPHSLTGEDVVELQLHGSPALASLVLREVLGDGEVRIAEPGEFTRRAFLNGRIDLLRAEAVADLVAAESEVAVRAAAAQLRGAVSREVEAAHRALEDVAADVEGLLDFPEEASAAEQGLASKLAAASAAIAGLVQAAARARPVRRSGRVVLAGPVNAGKSTLFNALLGEERALVDVEAGTTRDVIEAPWLLEGLVVTLVDTAGLRESPGRIEALGIERAHAAIAGADLVVLLLSPEVSGAEASRWASRLPPRSEAIWVHTKADLTRMSGSGLHISARTGEGLPELRAAVSERLGLGGGAVATGTFSDRAEAALSRAQENVQRATTALIEGPLELVAGELALALGALSDVTGSSTPQSVLDEVFRRFCIGK